MLEAALLADEVAVMIDGKIVERKKLEDLFSSKNESVADFLSARVLFERLRV